MTITLEDASTADAPQILSIYNEVLSGSTAIYSEDPGTLDYIQGWITQRLNDGYPLIKAVDDKNQLLGYATYGQFRARPGYRFTIEHTVHVSNTARGQGVGAILMKELIARAKADGYHLMIGAVDAANEGSLVFHDRLGFARSSVIKEVGYKFERWLDLVFVQLRLDSEPE